MRQKALLYFVLNHTPSVVDLWKITINSLVKHSSQALADSYINLLVITNETYAPNVRYFADIKNLRVTIVVSGAFPDAELFDSRMRRFDVFELSHIVDVYDYDVVMHLDYDCVIHKCLWQHLLRPCIPKLVDGVLYAYNEQGTHAHHKIFYGFKEYTTDDIKRFKRDRIYPFSTGVFMIRPTFASSELFRKVKTFINKTKRKTHFYEQSGANVYLNNRELCNTRLLRHLVQSRNIKPNHHGHPRLKDHDIDTRTVVTHFCGIGYEREKAQRMRRFVRFLDKLHPCV